MEQPDRFYLWIFFLLHVPVQCTGISQAEFYAAVESLRVDGPIYEISVGQKQAVRWMVVSAFHEDIIWCWSRGEQCSGPTRSASAFSCRKSALPAFFPYRREACIQEDMNIARL